MARKPRIEFENAFYHVITRGNQKLVIFKDDHDYSQYLSILSTYKERYGFIIYSYALMSNHVHMLIETTKTPLSKIMQGINQSYTMYYNRKYGAVGHLFQGRYKAILCDRDRYQLSLVKYIHMNPVRAGIVEKPEEYIWSSHNCYLLNEDKTGTVDTESVLAMFSADRAAANRLYRVFMERDPSIPKQDVYCTFEQRILGDENFVEKVRKEGNAQVHAKRPEREYSLGEIAGAIEAVYGLTLAEIRSISKSARLSAGKRMMSLVAHEYGYKGREIASFVHKDPVVVTRHLKEISASEKEIEGVVIALKKRSTGSSPLR